MPLAKIRRMSRLMRARAACFDADSFDPQVYQRIMAKPAPSHTYGILFTPRSGSTRITQLLEDAGVSNAPREYFNDISMPVMAAKHSARSLPDYVDLIKREQQVGGRFGFEITYQQILFAFMTPKRFVRMMRPDRSAWLIREDAVAQAVSVSRLQQTRVPHAPRATDDGHAKAEHVFEYRPAEIASALTGLVRSETRTEGMIARFGFDPFRLSYEMVNDMGPDRTVKVLAEALELPLPASAVPDTHHKLKGQKAAEFADRFRRDHGDLIASLTKTRAPLLRKLRDQNGLGL